MAINITKIAAILVMFRRILVKITAILVMFRRILVMITAILVMILGIYPSFLIFSMMPVVEKP